MQNYSLNKNKCSWTPNKTGIYYMLACIKNSNSSYAQDRIEKCIKVVKAGENIKIDNVALSNATNKEYAVNTTFTFTANASGGTESNKLQYSFWRYDERGYRLIKDYNDKNFSGENFLEWTPTKPGVYTILVRVKGENSGSYEDEKAFTYTISDPSTSGIKIDSFEINGSSKRMTNHILTANANNSNPSINANNPTLMYKFVVTDILYGYKLLQDFSPLNYCNHRRLFFI